MTWHEKAFLVTGGASGIGAATARALAAKGAHVALVDRTPPDQVVEEIRGAGGTALGLVADVGDPLQVASSVSQVVNEFGRLDGAFNNAGINQRRRLLHELSPEQWDETLRVNLSSVFYCLKYEVEAMLELGTAGTIVNTASALGKVAIPNAAEYVASKHGVVGLTRAAAADYGPSGIRINAVLPGIVETGMTQMSRQTVANHADFANKMRDRHLLGRFADPSEIASAVVWLLSSASTFVTGESFAVDGGFLAN